MMSSEGATLVMDSLSAARTIAHGDELGETHVIDRIFERTLGLGRVADHQRLARVMGGQHREQRKGDQSRMNMAVRLV